MVTHIVRLHTARLPRLELVGDADPRRRLQKAHASTRPCCCPAPTRSWRRRGCPTRSASSPATSPRATCCPSRTRTRGWSPPTPSATTRSTPTPRRRCARSPRTWASGRVRTLSLEGTDMAAERWYDGDGGPEAPSPRARRTPAASCGFLVRLAGPLVGHVRRLRQRQRQRRRQGRHVQPRLRRPLRGQARPQAAADPGARPRLRHPDRRRVRALLSAARVRPSGCGQHPHGVLVVRRVQLIAAEPPVDRETRRCRVRDELVGRIGPAAGLDGAAGGSRRGSGRPARAVTAGARARRARCPRRGR